MRPAAGLLSLIVAGVMAHGLLGLTDHVLWDGFWYHAQLAQPTPTGMLRLFHEIGRPLDLAFVKTASWLPGPYLCKWMSLIAWILVSPLVFVVLRRGALLPAPLAWMAAALAVTAPCFEVLGDLAVWPNTLAVLLFWCGWLLAVTTGPRVWSRAAAAVLWLLSFNLNSQLVFFYGLVTCMVLMRLSAPGSADRGPWWRSLGGMLRRRPEVPLLPLVFWAAKQWLTPASGHYAGYNQPEFSIQRLGAGFASFGEGWVGGSLSELAALPPWCFAIGAAIAVCAVLPRAARRRLACGDGDELNLPRCSLLVIAAFGLLAAAAVPYIAVGQGFASEGWLTRNTILMPVPVALLAAAAAIGINRLLAPRLPWLWAPPLIALIIPLAAASNANYLRLQALGAKQDAVRQHLATVIRDQGAVAIQLRDQLPVPGTIPYYPPLIWTHLAAGLGKQPRAIVVETAMLNPSRVVAEGAGYRMIHPVVDMNRAMFERVIQETTMPYIFTHLPRQGPQRMIVVEPGRIAVDPVQLGARYLWATWADPGLKQRLLDDIAKVSVAELPPVGLE